MIKEEKKQISLLNFIAYLITSVILGIAFFLLFLNIYHYNEVNYVYEKSDEEIAVSKELKSELEIVSTKLAAVNIENYSSSSNYQVLVDTNERLNKCLTILNNEKLHNQLEKKEMTIVDIYDFQEAYQNEVVNECLVKQLYGISDLNEDSDIMNNFIRNNIDMVLTDVSYVKNNLLNNSSYYIVTNSSKNNIFDLYKESYYQIVTSYRKTINFVDMVADWYINSLGGTNE